VARWEDQDQLVKVVQVEGKVNVELLEQWELLVVLDFQEDKDHEEPWDDVEDQEVVESKENQVQWDQKDQVDLPDLPVN
jgi:hypothetical protein